ncbi:hypothetical protein B0H21DRAFT_712057 [Amylocystis lapponica]|nr:hypothetical protein B0H21DRAFT_712057 [Amylocystis lapponica]
MAGGTEISTTCLIRQVAAGALRCPSQLSHALSILPAALLDDNKKCACMGEHMHGGARGGAHGPGRGWAGWCKRGCAHEGVHEGAREGCVEDEAVKAENAVEGVNARTSTALLVDLAPSSISWMSSHSTLVPCEGVCMVGLHFSLAYVVLKRKGEGEGNCEGARVRESTSAWTSMWMCVHERVGASVREMERHRQREKERVQAWTGKGM